MTIPSKYVLPVFFLIIFLGAMVLGPILYWSLQPWHVAFHRAMDRALTVCAVVALIIFRSRISLKKLWPWNSDAWKQLLLGYFIAAVSAQAMIGFMLANAGFTSAHLSASEIGARILMTVVAALLLPPIEETIFRGFIQNELVQSLGMRAGWIIGALIFTVAHFIKVPSTLDHEPVHLWSGITSIGVAFQSLGHGDFLSGKGLNLFLIGLILGGVFLRTETLWLNAGLHSGWILALLFFTGVTHPVDHPSIEFFGGDILSSAITSVVLILLGLWLWRFYRHPSVLPETGENAPLT